MTASITVNADVAVSVHYDRAVASLRQIREAVQDLARDYGRGDTWFTELEEMADAALSDLDARYFTDIEDALTCVVADLEPARVKVAVGSLEIETADGGYPASVRIDGRETRCRNVTLRGAVDELWSATVELVPVVGSMLPS